MTFQEWLNENEGFSLRMERIYDDLVKKPKDLIDFDNWQGIKVWLEAAYNTGLEEGSSSKNKTGCKV